MVDPMHFEANAAIYGAARPPYPPELWDTLDALALLTPGLRVLELGAGTGQATGPLLDAGLSVTAVEPGVALAAQLRASYPAATVIVDRAEDVRLPRGEFDLAVAATSIHWMDLDTVLPRIHRALTPDGVLLVWRNVFGDPAVPTPFREYVTRIVEKRTTPPRSGPDPEDLDATATGLTRNGLFSVRAMRTFRWRIVLDDQQVLRLFMTFSDWTAVEAEHAAAAVRELGGRVVENYRTWLIVLDRTPTDAAARAGLSR